MQLLERSGLLLRVLVPSSHSSFDVGLTRLGWHAVQTGTVMLPSPVPASRA